MGWVYVKQFRGAQVLVNTHYISSIQPLGHKTCEAMGFPDLDLTSITCDGQTLLVQDTPKLIACYLHEHRTEGLLEAAAHMQAGAEALKTEKDKKEGE
jgi:hypothetical protein